MSHNPIWDLLTRKDEELAKTYILKACPHCEGAFRREDFPRKVRGVEGEDGTTFRISFRCKKCRRRTTPPSYRFIYKKVYAALAMVFIFFFLGFIPSKSKRTQKRWKDFFNKNLSLNAPLLSFKRFLFPLNFKYTYKDFIDQFFLQEKFHHKNFSQNFKKDLLFENVLLKFCDVISFLSFQSNLMFFFFSQRMPGDSSA